MTLHTTTLPALQGHVQPARRNKLSLVVGVDFLSGDTHHCVLCRFEGSHGVCLGDKRHGHLRTPDDVHHHAPRRLLHRVGVRWRNDADALLASHQVQQSGAFSVPPYSDPGNKFPVFPFHFKLSISLSPIKPIFGLSRRWGQRSPVAFPMGPLAALKELLVFSTLQWPADSSSPVLSFLKSESVDRPTVST